MLLQDVTFLWLRHVLLRVKAPSAGVNGEPFYLVFAEDWFADGEIIEGPYNDIYPIRILDAVWRVLMQFISVSLGVA